MKILKSRLAEIARSFLNVIGREKINSVEDLKTNKGRRIKISTSPKTFLEISARPSNLGSVAHRISYIIYKREGTPIELVFNGRFGYFNVIIKSYEQIPGFEPFSVLLPRHDVYGNLMQYKAIFCDNLFSEAKKELEELARLG